ncbi:hypothetical protein FMUND_12380 [Fusarium mundagurra]|uniref:Uncharacterized protein n=1 Tax=Fusarium mundagurra TaxID=1567541 RepID=A0A8H5Y4E8_9HYPO|nr:hypothetical protein FMUND_12380 [Fusarium mundagurra]
MHRSRNNKRNMEEMGGQVEPESYRPAKRLHHDHVRQEEAIMQSQPNNKRNIHEMNGQFGLDLGRPAKRMDYGYSTGPTTGNHDMIPDEARMYSSPAPRDSDTPIHPVRSKRRFRPNANGDDDTMRDEAQLNHGLGGEVTTYANRVQIYHALLQMDIDETLKNALDQVYLRDMMVFVEVLHDSPQHIRSWALEQWNEKFRRSMVDEMSDIERKKKINDPKSALPTIMTDSLACELVGTRSCVVCKGGFCSENKQNPVDVEDVVWKDCGVHLMHLECFRRQVSEGKMPLKGLCACIDNDC